MLNAFMFTLREGIEAFLIVAITLAYLRKTGRAKLGRAVHLGVAVALVASYLASLLFARAENRPLWEGVLALVTAVLVGTFTLQVLRTAKFMRRDIEGRIEHAALQEGAWAFVGVFAFTVLMITREGMEAALLLSASFMQSGARLFFYGATGGLLAAALLALLWSRFGHRIHLGRFLQVTAVFLLLFLVQLLIYGFHEITESGLLPIDNTYWHLVTEPYGPEGRYGHWLTYALVVLPLGWLLSVSIGGGFSRSTQVAR
ncbi:high-affinity iron transporter [Povalibacter uvarum]|uniref:High-affinity iron transporter n=1 Tax=Povalibacter uvarum TaxID=732238 RepID=A0A841HTY2_9GAMM|nr:FTR1 family protein [Povalibacter uvarum]MBB6096366.1 high-affinity iron transporter [Povalibacter uvarum]